MAYKGGYQEMQEVLVASFLDELQVTKNIERCKVTKPGRKNPPNRDNDDEDPPPNRPTSAYNLFFRMERRRLLENIANGQLVIVRSKLDDMSDDCYRTSKNETPTSFELVGTSNNSSATTDYVYTNEEVADFAIRERLETCPRNLRPKRKHVKSHGLIGFREMARYIATRWKSVSPEVIEHFQNGYEIEKNHYRTQYDLWQHRQQCHHEQTNITKKTKNASDLHPLKNTKSFSAIKPNPNSKGRKDHTRVKATNSIGIDNCDIDLFDEDITSCCLLSRSPSSSTEDIATPLTEFFRPLSPLDFSDQRDNASDSPKIKDISEKHTNATKSDYLKSTPSPSQSIHSAAPVNPGLPANSNRYSELFLPKIEEGLLTEEIKPNFVTSALPNLLSPGFEDIMDPEHKQQLNDVTHKKLFSTFWKTFKVTSKFQSYPISSRKVNKTNISNFTKSSTMDDVLSYPTNNSTIHESNPTNNRNEFFQPQRTFQIDPITKNTQTAPSDAADKGSTRTRVINNSVSIGNCFSPRYIDYSTKLTQSFGSDRPESQLSSFYHDTHCFAVPVVNDTFPIYPRQTNFMSDNQGRIAAPGSKNNDCIHNNNICLSKNMTEDCMLYNVTLKPQSLTLPYDELASHYNVAAFTNNNEDDSYNINNIFCNEKEQFFLDENFRF